MKGTFASWKRLFRKPEPSNVVDFSQERAKRWLAKYARPMTRGMEGALDAIHGPPPTPEQLAEDRSRIAKQRARDEGIGGLL